MPDEDPNADRCCKKCKGTGVIVGRLFPTMQSWHPMGHLGWELVWERKCSCVRRTNMRPMEVSDGTNQND